MAIENPEKCILCPGCLERFKREYGTMHVCNGVAANPLSHAYPHHISYRPAKNRWEYLISDNTNRAQIILKGGVFTKGPVSWDFKWRR